MDKPIRILLAGNNAAVDAALRARTKGRAQRYEVKLVTDDAGFQRALGFSYDVAIADFSSVWIDPFEVLSRLKACDAGLPLIVLFGTAAAAKAQAALKRGFDAYIVCKGSYLRQLTSAIRRAVTERTQEVVPHNAEARLRALFENMPVGLYRMTPGGTIVEANPALVQISGCPDLDSFLSHNAEDFFVSKNNFDKWCARVDAEGGLLDFEGPALRIDGKVIWVRNSVRPVCDAGKRVLYYEGAIEDISARREAELAMRRERNLSDKTIDSMPGIFYLFDETGHYLRWNRTLEIVSGYSAEEFQGLHPLDLVVPEERAFIEQKMQEAFTQGSAEAELVVLTKNGRRIPYHCTAQRIDLDGRACLVGCGVDVSERKRAEARLHFLAHFDGLTGLPNRTLLHDRLQQALIEAGRHKRVVGVVHLDVDRFKTVNESLGHQAGDELIKSAAERLTGVLRKGDTVARLSGDEFAIVLADMAHADDATRIVRKLVEAFTQPFHINGRELYITVSLGVTLYPVDESDAQGLLRDAEVALYRAKESGRNTFQFYSADMALRAAEDLELENDLRQAIAHNELLLHYQPLVEARSSRIIGVEALVRWNHARRGMISPANFIPIAEESGMIMQIGEWVLREACRQCHHWRTTGQPDLKIAVNLSARQFQQKGLDDTVIAILEETHLDPAALELELTESIIMHSSRETLAVMQRLADMGVTFSIDDFGTGYSNLSYLKRFPVDVLKIDRTFVLDIPDDLDDAAIADAIITMAHSLGMRVIAEGVETERQLVFMRAHGCDTMQGFFFSRPLPPDELSALLMQHSPLPFARKTA